jgi:hypothetical protein
MDDNKYHQTKAMGRGSMEMSSMLVVTTWGNDLHNPGVKVVFIVLKELTGYVDLSFSRINLLALGIIVLKNGPKCRLNPKPESEASIHC